MVKVFETDDPSIYTCVEDLLSPHQGPLGVPAPHTRGSLDKIMITTGQKSKMHLTVQILTHISNIH